MFGTIVLYYGLLTVASVSNILSTQVSRTKAVVFISFSFFLLFLLAALRFDIGTDYSNYIRVYDTIVSTGTYNYTDYGYVLINKVFISIGLSHYWVFFLFSFLTLLFVYRAFPQKHITLLVFLYITSNFYFQSFSLIRQMLAVAIAANAIKYAISNNWIKFAIWILVASFVHKSALIYLPFYLFRNISVNRFYSFLVFIWFVLILKTGVAEYLFREVVKMTPYGNYVGSAMDGKEVVIGSGLGVLFRVFFGIIPLFFSAAIIKNNPSAKLPLLLLFFFELAYILGLKVHVFNRLGDVFNIYFIWSIPYFIDIFSVRSRLFIRSIVVVSFLLLMYKNISGDYAQQSGGVGVVPYKSIINGGNNELD